MCFSSSRAEIVMLTTVPKARRGRHSFLDHNTAIAALRPPVRSVLPGRCPALRLASARRLPRPPYPLAPERALLMPDSRPPQGDPAPPVTPYRFARLLEAE